MKHKIIFLFLSLFLPLLAYSQMAKVAADTAENPCDRHFESAIKFIVDTPKYHPFSINSNGDQVLFSRGNLQYCPSRDKWRFALRQFDRVGNGKAANPPAGAAYASANYGITTVFYDSIDYSTPDQTTASGYKEIRGVPCNNLMNSKYYDGWIDLFAWGTSGQGKKVHDQYTVHFYPYSLSSVSVNTTYNTYGYGPSYGGGHGKGALTNNFDTASGSNRYFDWGYAYIREYSGCSHSVSGALIDVLDSTMYRPGIWRTLTNAEWTYLLITRRVAGNDSAFSYVRLKYGPHATDTVTGVVIYPDDFNFYNVGVAPLPFGSNYAITQISYATWEALEDAGCVFLPSVRYSTLSDEMLSIPERDYGSFTCYWSSTAYNASSAYNVYFNFGGRGIVPSNYNYRYVGNAVRLVQDYHYVPVKKEPYYSVSPSDKVTFAKGNLLYSPGRDEWRIADRQFDRAGNGVAASKLSGRLSSTSLPDKPLYDAGPSGGITTIFWDSAGFIVPSNNLYCAEDYGGWVDVFAWGTSGHGRKVGDEYATLFYPYDFDDKTVNATYNKLGYGPSYGGGHGKGALTDDIDKASGKNRYFDWGYANTIKEGSQSYRPGTWRTLNNDEWDYLLHSRTNSFSFVRLKYGTSSSDTVTGVLLYPDKFKFSEAGIEPIPVGTNSGITQVDANTWSALEGAGCTFLPGASYTAWQSDKLVLREQEFGLVSYYWSSSAANASDAHNVQFNLSSGSATLQSSSRGLNYAVRLVKDRKLIIDPDIDPISLRTEPETRYKKVTVSCGEVYNWDMDYKKQDMPQAAGTTVTYRDTVRSQYGLDSVISILELTVKDINVKELAIEYATTDCNSYYSWSINYGKEFVNKEVTLKENEDSKDIFDTLRSVYGCDSIIARLKLKNGKVALTKKDFVYDTVCDLNTYTWTITYDSKRTVNRTFTPTAGTHDYFDTLRSVAGCDSVIAQLKLTAQNIIVERKPFVYDTVWCGGTTYKWTIKYDSKHTFDTIITQTEGTKEHFDTLRSVYGCDSVIAQLKLTIKEECTSYFSVSPTQKVKIASGNLQYNAVRDEWRFAERQFDRIGNGKQAVVPGGKYQTAGYGVTTVFWEENGETKPCDNNLISKTYGGWQDLFAWGTSTQGWRVGDAYAKYFNPYDLNSDVVNTTYNYYGYGPSYGGGRGSGAKTDNMDTNSGSNVFFDWGHANEIYEGKTKHKTNTWRTLTSAEWTYLLTTREVDGKDSAFTYVRLTYGSNATDTVSGVVLYPDEFTFELAGVTALPFGPESGVQTIDMATWLSLEKAGCVFLPNAGAYSYENNVLTVMSDGMGASSAYWSSTASSVNYANSVCFNFTDACLCSGVNTYRTFGLPVRLVRDKTPSNDTVVVHVKLQDTIDTVTHIVTPIDTCVMSYTWKAINGDQVLKPKEKGLHTYFDTLRSKSGSDSIISTLKLTVKHKDLERKPFVYDTVCDLNTYTWTITYDDKRTVNRTFEPDAGTKDYFDTLRSVNGCDSVIAQLKLTAQNITIEKKPFVYDTLWCGTTYTWTITYDSKHKVERPIQQASGTQEHFDTLRSIYGCDSVIAQLKLTNKAITLERKPFEYDTVCNLNNYTWSITYDSKRTVNRTFKPDAGTKDYFDTLRSVNGCDSVIAQLKLTAQNLTVVKKPFVYDTVCDLKTYTWSITYDSKRKVNRTFNPTKGTKNYFDTLRSVYGCDSVIAQLKLTAQNLTVEKKPFVYDTVCDLKTYTWSITYDSKHKVDRTITPTVGTKEHFDTLRSIYGCDSVIARLKLSAQNLTAKIKPYSATVLPNATYSWNMEYKTKSIKAPSVAGTYEYSDTLRSKYGCDSVISTLKLTVEKPFESGNFSVSSTKKVKFSPGNLQYCAAQNKWRFAERQFDRVGNGKQAVVPGGKNQTPGYGITTVFWDDNGEIKPCNNLLISSTYGGWIDLFGWGTGDNPTKTSSNYYDYWTFTDWGTNVIGSDPANTWRTPTKDEWTYLLQTRQVNGGAGYSFVRLKYGDNATDTVTGVVIYPDDFTFAKAGVSAITVGNGGFTQITADTWNKLEKAGCVFLPGSRRRSLPYIIEANFGLNAYYWSATESSASHAYNAFFIFSGRNLNPAHSDNRVDGVAVRLIQDL